MAKSDTSKHILVPKHTKVSDKEKDKVLEQYQITFNQLPKISSKDPALLGMDLKAGDVIKVERNSPTAGKSVFYRGVF